MILAIDPGPRVCGVVLYDPGERHVLLAHGAADVEEVIAGLDAWRYGPVLADGTAAEVATLAIERVQSQGQSGADLLLTAEVVGRLYQRALDAGWRDVRLVPRRVVTRHLDVSGGGKDAQVRQRLIEMHGGSTAAAIGTKRAPGPLYGVTSHAWQALGLAVVVAEGGA